MDGLFKGGADDGKKGDTSVMRGMREQVAKAKKAATARYQGKTQQESSLRKAVGKGPQARKMAEWIMANPAWARNENESTRTAIVKAITACNGDLKKMHVIRSIVGNREFARLPSALREKVLARTVKDPSQIGKYGKAYLTILRDGPFPYAKSSVKERLLSHPLEWSKRTMNAMCTTSKGEPTEAYIPDEETVERRVHRYLSSKNIGWEKRLFQSVKVAAWENVAHVVRSYTKFFREHWYEKSAAEPGWTLGEVWKYKTMGKDYWSRSFSAQKAMGKMVGCVADFDERTRRLVCQAPYESLDE